MTSRIAAAFAGMKASGRTGLVTYVTAGDPDPGRSADVLRALARGGADVIEVGVPFSDPLADGPTIQRASERALRAGTTLSRTLDLVREVRRDVDTPMVLFTYANPVARVGFEPFAREAAAAGVDGCLVLDLPLEEAGPLRAALDRVAVDPIFLLSPTTTTARIAEAARLGRGFLYAISRLGVTGAREAVASGAEDLVRRIRTVSTLPVALGFGLSNPGHVAEVGRFADAAVVGSALVAVIERDAARADLPDRVERFVRWLKGEGPALAGGSS